MNWNLSKECRKKFLKHLFLNASPKLFKVNLKNSTNPSFNLLNNNKQNYLVVEVMINLRWCQLYIWWKSLKQNFARKLTIHFKILLFLLLFCYVFFKGYFFFCETLNFYFPDNFYLKQLANPWLYRKQIHVYVINTTVKENRILFLNSCYLNTLKNLFCFCAGFFF